MEKTEIKISDGVEVLERITTQVDTDSKEDIKVKISFCDKIISDAQDVIDTQTKKKEALLEDLNKFSK